MPTALFIKTKYRNFAPILDQKSALEGIFLVAVQAKDGLPFADQVNARGEKSSKTMLLRYDFSSRLSNFVASL